MALYDVGLVVTGLAILGAVVLPRVLSDKPLSFPLLYVLAGVVLFSLPLGTPEPNPVAHPEVAERLTELVVIVALMGAGLKLDRPFALGAWSSAWRLLGIAMPLTIAATALLAWGVLGALPATAILLGAVIAPTAETDEDIDPAEQEGSIRFALTAEAGLNDGLAFPFTNLALAVAAAGAGWAWLGDWALYEVAYKILVGVVAGYVLGRVLAWIVFGNPATTKLAETMSGAEALAGTLLIYGLTELVAGYGFIAVFVGALVVRHYEWEHDYYEELHDFAVVVERLVMAALLVLFGGAIATGLLWAVSPLGVLVAVGIVLVVRPLAGMISLVGSSLLGSERLVVSTFGVRGIGSFYYLAYALNHASFQEVELLLAAEEVWAIVGVAVLTSIIVHGASASLVMRTVDHLRTFRRATGSKNA